MNDIKDEKAINNAKRLIEAIKRDLDNGFLILDNLGNPLLTVNEVLDALGNGDDIEIINPDETFDDLKEDFDYDSTKNEFLN